jgi:hypothetical protein
VGFDNSEPTAHNQVRRAAPLQPAPRRAACVRGVVLIDAPPDAAAVRLAAAQRADRWVIAVDAPWTAAMVLDAVSDRL